MHIYTCTTIQSCYKELLWAYSIQKLKKSLHYDINSFALYSVYRSIASCNNLARSTGILCLHRSMYNNRLFASRSNCFTLILAIYNNYPIKLISWPAYQNIFNLQNSIGDGSAMDPQTREASKQVNIIHCIVAICLLKLNLYNYIELML